MYVYGTCLFYVCYSDCVGVWGLYNYRKHVNCVHTLSLAKSNHVSVERFDIGEIKFILDYIQLA